MIKPIGLALMMFTISGVLSSCGKSSDGEGGDSANKNPTGLVETSTCGYTIEAESSAVTKVELDRLTGDWISDAFGFSETTYNGRKAYSKSGYSFSSSPARYLNIRAIYEDAFSKSPVAIDRGESTTNGLANAIVISKLLTDSTGKKVRALEFRGVKGLMNGHVDCVTHFYYFEDSAKLRLSGPTMRKSWTSSNSDGVDQAPSIQSLLDEKPGFMVYRRQN